MRKLTRTERSGVLLAQAFNDIDRLTASLRGLHSPCRARGCWHCSRARQAAKTLKAIGRMLDELIGSGARVFFK